MDVRDEDFHRTWADQIRFNKPRDYIFRGFRLLHKKGIQEWNGKSWNVISANEVAILSTSKVRKIE